MTRSIYVLATEGQTAKSVVGLGIVEGLTREVEKVGVFRPIIKGGPKRDGVLDALTSLPAVRQRYSDAVGVTYEEVRNDPDGALTQIVNKFNAVKDQFDAVVIVGSDYSDVMASTELAYNAKIAANLSSPVCLAVSSRNREPNEVLNLARNALAECAKQHAKAIAVIATRVPGDERCDEYADALTAIPDVFTGAIPAHPLLAAPSLEQQLSAVGAKVITGRREQLQRESQGVLLASMTLPNVLERLFTEATVIVPADRAELIPGILMAHTSGSFPQLTGMILVGGDEIPAPIQSLMSSVHHELPIAACNRSSYETAERLFRIEGIMTSSPRKVELARRLFNERIDITALMEKMKLAPSDIVTPLMFESKLNEMARKNKRTIVLPESGDDRILEAAAIVLDRGTAGIILLGDATTIKTRATQLGLSLDGAEIVDPTDEDLIERFASEYARLRAQGSHPRGGQEALRGRLVRRHDDGPHGHGPRNGLGCREHHGQHDPAVAGVREDQAGREGRILVVPDVHARPGGRLRRLRGQPEPDCRGTRRHRDRLGGDRGRVRHRTARRDAVLLDRNVGRRRGRREGGRRHRIGPRQEPQAQG